jgi:Outer membrane protein beta-barrel domain
MKTFFITLLCCVGLLYQQGYSQTSCAQTLRLAQSIYESGRLHELENTLAECLKGNNFTTQEKVAAYKLLTLAYIYLEEPDKADKVMLEILTIQKEFQVNPEADPAEFVALYKTFRTKPIYRLGGKAAFMASQPNVVSANKANDGFNEYSNGFGFGISVTAEIPFLDKWNLTPELQFGQRSHNSSNQYGTRTTTGTETQQWIGLPIAVQYELWRNPKRGKVVYVSAGASIEYLLSASKRLETQIDNYQPVKESDVDVYDQRKHINSTLLIGAGFKKKLSSGYLITEIRYQQGLLQLSSTDQTFANNTQLFNYQDVDALYRMNSLSLSIAYVVNVYRPIKLTR